MIGVKYGSLTVVGVVTQRWPRIKVFKRGYLEHLFLGKLMTCLANNNNAASLEVR